MGGHFLLPFFFVWAGGSRTGNCHTHRGGTACTVVAVAKRRTVVTFGLLCCPRVSKVSTVTGIRGVLVAKLIAVVAFGFACCPLRGTGREMQNCRRSWPRLWSPSWSRNAEVSTVTRIRGVLCLVWIIQKWRGSLQRSS